MYKHKNNVHKHTNGCTHTHTLHAHANTHTYPHTQHIHACTNTLAHAMDAGEIKGSGRVLELLETVIKSPNQEGH